MNVEVDEYFILWAIGSICIIIFNDLSIGFLFFIAYNLINSVAPSNFYLPLILAAEGHSIYIRNLPLNITVAQLEFEFKKFGPIKQGGVQVRSDRVDPENIFYTLSSSHLLICIS